MASKSSSNKTIIISSLPSVSRAGEQQIFTEEKEGWEYKIGRLEIQVALVEKSLEDKINQVKWIIGSAIVIIGVAIAGVQLVFNIHHESQKNYFALQDRYYNELLTSKENTEKFRQEMQSSIQELDRRFPGSRLKK